MPHHIVLIIEQELRQGARQFGLSDAGGSEKNKRADRPVGILESGAGADHRVGDRFHRFVLSDHALVQMLAELEQFFLFAFEQSRNRNPGPARNHRRDIILVDFLLDQLHAALFLEPLFFFRQLALELRELAVLELGHAVQIVLPLGLLHGELAFFDLLFEPAQPSDRLLFHVPTRSQLLLLRFQDPPAPYPVWSGARARLYRFLCAALRVRSPVA